MPEEFIEVEIHLVLSIPQEIWLQGTAYKPDELFWQVQFVMLAQVIFRGFPISLNTKHNCGRILFVCLFFKMWQFKPCKPLLMLSGWWAKLRMKTLTNTRKITLRIWKVDTKILSTAKFGQIALM